MLYQKNHLIMAGRSREIWNVGVWENHVWKMIWIGLTRRESIAKAADLRRNSMEGDLVEVYSLKGEMPYSKRSIGISRRRKKALIKKTREELYSELKLIEKKIARANF